MLFTQLGIWTDAQWTGEYMGSYTLGNHLILVYMDKLIIYVPAV